MRETLFFLIFFSIPLMAGTESEKEALKIVKEYHFKFPLLACVSDEYRSCYNNISIEQCVIDLKGYRNVCHVSVDSSDYHVVNANFQKYSRCMLLKHAGYESLESIVNDTCLGTMQFSLEESELKVNSLNRDTVDSLLK